MGMKAIVMTGTDQTEITQDLEFQKKLGPKDVMVQIMAAGVCASDSSLLSGKYGLPTPVVMGHEGAGIVKEIGEAVTSCAVGDHCVLSTLGSCGECAVCEAGNPTLCGSPQSTNQPYLLNEEPVYQFAQVSCFAESTIVRHQQVIPISREVPFTTAALIGCGVITGIGSVFNRAKVQPGDTVAVVGAGGVGLNVIQAAALSGASQVIALDLAASKESLAKQFGATDFIKTSTEDFDLAGAVKDLIADGVDHSFEVVGSNELIRACIDLTKPGGNIVSVGVPPLGSEVSFVHFSLYQNKNLMGCRYGAARPRADFPMIVDLYLRGKLLLDELVTHTYKLEDYEIAFNHLTEGIDARSVLTLN